MANSYIDYTGNGSLTAFTAPSYLEKTHIQVVVDGVVKTLNTDYSIADGSTSVVFGTAPAAASKIRISRSSSPAQRLTDYNDASLLTADAMDRDANQLFFLAQEAVDSAERTDFGAQTFYSSGTTDPSTANAGDLFFNSQTGLLKIYNGSAWESVNNRGHKQTFAISGSTTVFTPSNPVDVNTLVFLNGVLLVEGSGSNGDYTASSTQVTLNVAVTSGVVEIVSFPNAAFVGTVNAVDGVFSGDLTCNDLTTASLSLTYNSSSIGFATPKTLLRETGNGDFRIEGQDLQLNVSDASSPSFANGVVYKRIDCEAGSTGSVALWYGANAKKLETTSTGIDVTGTVAASDGLTADYIDLTGGKSTNTTGTICADKIRFSAQASDEASIYASVDGLNTSLFIQSADDAADKVRIVAGGTESLTVASTGINVTGTVTADGVSLGDNEQIQLGASGDLKIYHNGSHSKIEDTGTGNLVIEGNEVSIKDSDGNRRVYSESGNSGSARLYYGTDSNEKLATTSTGVDVTGTVTADGVALGNNEKITFGGESDGKLEIYESTGGNGFIEQSGDGNLVLKGQDITLSNNADQTLIKTLANTAQLFNRNGDNAGLKLETTNTGIDVTGTVTADLVKLNPTGGASEGGQIEFERAVDNQTAWYVDAHGSDTDTSLRFVDNDDTSNPVTRVSINNAGINVTGEVKGDSLFIDNSNSLNTAALVNSSTGRSMLSVISTFEGTVSEQEASIEIGANKLAFIDFKTPDTDDYDLRIYHSEPENLSMVNSLNEDLFLRSGGKVALQHAGANTRLETTSTGIEVTGTVTADGVTISSPNGTQYNIVVADDGTLSTTAA